MTGVSIQKRAVALAQYAKRDGEFWHNRIAIK